MGAFRRPERHAAARLRRHHRLDGVPGFDDDDGRSASLGASAAPLCWTRPARRSPTWSTPTRAAWSSGPTAPSCSTRWPTHRRRGSGLGYETVVTRLDDEANIAPWLRAANRYGAKVKWAEVDIETGELPNWQWENLITEATRLVAITSASATLGTVTDLRAATKLMHADGGLVIVDHSAAAPYRLIDIDEIDADVVAVNALGVGRTAGRRTGVPRPRRHQLVRFDRAEPVRHRSRAAGDRRAPVRRCWPVWSPASNIWPPLTSRRRGRGGNGSPSRCSPRLPT